MTGREVVRVRDVARVVGGATPKTAEPTFWGGAIPWLTPKDLSDRPSRYTAQGTRFLTDRGLSSSSARLLPPGSVLLTSRAPIGLVTIATVPIATNQGFKSLVLDETQCPEYWYYLLASSGDYLRSVANGSTFLEISGKVVGDLEFEVPPLDEQRRIAEVLGAFDELIDTNERLTADAAELRRSLLAAALGVATEHHALSSIARFVNGKNFTKGADGTGRPIVRTPEVREGVKSATLRSSVEATDDFIARGGDLLFVWSGSLCLGRWGGDEALVNQHVFKVIPNAGMPDWYVYACLEWKLPWFLGLAADKATTMGHIQRAHLDAPVPKLSRDQLENLATRVSPLWELELELSCENAQLRRTRDELLPLLMSGAVRVLPEGIAA